MRQVGSVLWPRLRALQIYGANTGVGKTVVSTLLCKALRRRHPDSKVNYLKPISTGPLSEADDSHINKYTKGIYSKTLLQFNEPVSPHIAARGSKVPIDDNSIATQVSDELQSYVSSQDAFAVVETAGAVLSPAPSGNTQADLYRPLRLPVLLVGDSRLGGIGSTISAWESLHVRGYDVPSIMLFEDAVYGNSSYLKDYFRDRNVLTLSLPPPPLPNPVPEQDETEMRNYYESSHVHRDLDQFIDRFEEHHQDRISKLQTLPRRANNAIWHPFMQHTERSEKTIFAIDSAYGDHFQALTSPVSDNNARSDQSLLKPAFDGSASWWTQGLGHGNPSLALTAAHTAGRYGHVMFANAAHEPAVSLAELLLTSLGNPRLSKVFYSDNGSTGMEVAVKMALKAASKRYEWKPSDNVMVLGLKGSYHGDTMGTMDCSEPNVYNEKVEWYKGRGYWFDFPTIQMRNGKYTIDPPADDASVCPASEFESLDQIFDMESRGDTAKQYLKYIRDQLIPLIDKEGMKFGALIMEPVILGAGGMLFADPLFQHTLVQFVREDLPHLMAKDSNPVHHGSNLDWSGMPVIFDEVFTGLYRLGRISSSNFLQTKPDISVHAKLLTGGLLPLATTLASESVFEAFLSSDKSDALLHGHSYTAHAIGCDIANQSVKTMIDMDEKATWSPYKEDWKQDATKLVSGTKDKIWSMWSKDFVTGLSSRDDVGGVFAIGSVLAISLKDPAGSGYTSTAAIGLRDRMLLGSVGADQVVHSRVLGNVLYLMASMTARPETLAEVERMVKEALN